MALLDDAIEASGGMARWNSVSRFTLHLSIGGALFSDAGHADDFKDLIHWHHERRKIRYVSTRHDHDRRPRWADLKDLVSSDTGIVR